MAEQLTLRGTLKGHNGWVTQIATTPMFPDMILSSSRDKSIIIWKLTKVRWQGSISLNVKPHHLRLHFLVRVSLEFL